jgi:hypothetical protein
MRYRKMKLVRIEFAADHTEELTQTVTVAVPDNATDEQIRLLADLIQEELEEDDYDVQDSTLDNFSCSLETAPEDDVPDAGRTYSLTESGELVETELDEGEE